LIGGEDMLTDTHCHLLECYYDDMDKYVEEAKASDVGRIIVAATNLQECQEVIELGKKYDNVYYCLGIHPEFYDEDFQKLERLVYDMLSDPKFVAIGEIGLDYHYDKEHKAEQLALFKKQLKLAEDVDLPVIVHNRESTQDMVDSLRDLKARGIIHCFSGSLETAKILIKMGYYIGVGGVMTFKNSKVDEIIKELPIEKLTLETDAPFLTPEPFRGSQNTSKYVRVIAEYLANIKNITLDEVMKKTEENVQDIFDF